MFDELEKYKNKGHFFFESGNLLATVSREVPDLPGDYYIIRLSHGKPELVYIRKSGTIEQNGKFKNQLLRNRINNKHDGIKRQEYFEKKIEEENINALHLYWYVTFDEDHKDIPAYIEGVLLQRYFDIYGQLPPWNKNY